MFPKSLLLFFLIGAAFAKPGKNTNKFSQEAQDYLGTLHDACVKSIGVTDEQVENVDPNNVSDDMKCYMSCLMKESGWMKEDGSMDFDEIIANLKPSLRPHLEHVLEGCRGITVESNKCETAYKFDRCFLKVDPEGYFVP